MPKPRNIVQITAAQGTNKDGSACWRLFAFCDDGTVWEIDSELQEWVQLPPIPKH